MASCCPALAGGLGLCWLLGWRGARAPVGAVVTGCLLATSGVCLSCLSSPLESFVLEFGGGLIFCV
jgi:hypothetical protein